jgi:hypothetical protein
LEGKVLRADIARMPLAETSREDIWWAGDSHSSHVAL